MRAIRPLIGLTPSLCLSVRLSVCRLRAPCFARLRSGRHPRAGRQHGRGRRGGSGNGNGATAAGEIRTRKGRGHSRECVVVVGGGGGCWRRIRSAARAAWTTGTRPQPRSLPRRRRRRRWCRRRAGARRHRLRRAKRLRRWFAQESDTPGSGGDLCAVWQSLARQGNAAVARSAAAAVMAGRRAVIGCAIFPSHAPISLAISRSCVPVSLSFASVTHLFCVVRSWPRRRTLWHPAALPS